MYFSLAILSNLYYAMHMITYTTEEQQRCQALLGRALWLLQTGSLYSAAASGWLHTDTVALVNEIRAFFKDTKR
jgi:hypothetical protein